MARPRKTTSRNYRTPMYHKTSRRWRLRIEHAHGEKNFWWPARSDATVCPPEVIAAAVKVQDQWRLLCEDWYWIRLALKLERPNADWSKPVWVDAFDFFLVETDIAVGQRDVWKLVLSGQPDRSPLGPAEQPIDFVSEKQRDRHDDDTTRYLVACAGLPSQLPSVVPSSCDYHALFLLGRAE